jgi:hypothetical protein
MPALARATCLDQRLLLLGVICSCVLLLLLLLPP